MESAKTAGQLAYEEDVRRKSKYRDGMPRRPWGKLDAVSRWSWEREPTPREWPQPVGAA